MRPVRFAVVGCGKIGVRHLAVLRAEPEAEIAAVCDIDSGVVRQQSREFGVPGFTDYRQMLRRTDCDVVNICTPHGLHAAMTVEAAAEGRHVLVEKPMALSERDAWAMIDAAARSGTHLMVVKQNRFNVPVVMTRALLDRGALGRVHMVQCNVLWNRDEAYYRQSPWRGKKALEGGALFTQVSHFIDLMVWWFGPVTEAHAWLERKRHAIEFEDCGMALVRFKSDTMGSIAWTTCAYHKNFEGSLTLIGERGTVKIGGEYLNEMEHWDVRGEPPPASVAFSDRPNDYGTYKGTSSNHDKVMRNVIAYVRNETGQIVDGEVALETVRAIELIYENAVSLRLPNLDTYAVRLAQAAGQ